MFQFYSCYVFYNSFKLIDLHFFPLSRSFSNKPILLYGIMPTFKNKINNYVDQKYGKKIKTGNIFICEKCVPV